MLNDWYSSKKIREILKISPQCLYAMRKSNRIESRRISKRKYVFRLPESFRSEEGTTPGIAVYARVSTPKQKKDLQNQLSYLRQFVVANGNIVEESLVFSDIASGMNENRKGLNSLVTAVIDGLVSKVVISSKDRLTRFGFGYLKSFFERYNCEIVEVNLTEDKSFEQELTDDLIAIVHHFSMKFYGKRKNKIERFEKDLKSERSESK